MKDVNDDHVMMPNFPGNLLNYFAFSSSSASFEKKNFFTDLVLEKKTPFP